MAASDADPAHEEFWALKDVSFDIQQGDRVGIIGRNGASLGMSKAEIKKLFDGVVAFAEVERFLDTPVKCYSSYMNARLDYAMAAPVTERYA